MTIFPWHGRQRKMYRTLPTSGTEQLTSSRKGKIRRTKDVFRKIWAAKSSHRNLDQQSQFWSPLTCSPVSIASEVTSGTITADESLEECRQLLSQIHEDVQNHLNPISPVKHALDMIPVLDRLQSALFEMWRVLQGFSFTSAGFGTRDQTFAADLAMELIDCQSAMILLNRSNMETVEEALPVEQRLQSSATALIRSEARFRLIIPDEAEDAGFEAVREDLKEKYERAYQAMGLTGEGCLWNLPRSTDHRLGRRMRRRRGWD